MIKDKKGFTILELSAVIVIIGLLIAGASIAVINHMNKVKKNTYIHENKNMEWYKS